MLETNPNIERGVIKYFSFLLFVNKLAIIAYPRKIVYNINKILTNSLVKPISNKLIRCKNDNPAKKNNTENIPLIIRFFNGKTLSEPPKTYSPNGAPKISKQCNKTKLNGNKTLISSGIKNI